MSLAPRFQEVEPNSCRFRKAIATANLILTDTDMGTYSRHRHDEMTVPEGWVIFEERVSAEKLELYPLDEREAARRGKPSCWGIERGKSGKAKIVVLRYADNALHDESDVDVESAAFLAQLDQFAAAFVETGIDQILELNVTGTQLFPAPPGMITQEDTIGPNLQMVTFAPRPAHLDEGDWTSAACWSFLGSEPRVAGVCSEGHGGI